MAVSFKGAHVPKDIVLMDVRWYAAYRLSTRQVEELMEERGVTVDHSTINRWVIKYSPQLEEAFHRRKQPVWVSWRLDETYGYCWRTYFTPDEAEISTAGAPSLCAFRGEMCEVKLRRFRIRQQHPDVLVKGQWYYLYRAVDEEGQTIDFLLTAQRDKDAALRFLKRPSAVIGPRRRSPLMRARPTRPPSAATTRHTARQFLSSR